MISVPTMAVILAVLIGTIIILVSGSNPILAYYGMLKGSFGSMDAILRTLEKATPLIFSGLAVTIGFKAGLFNIGAQGQLLTGALASAAVGFMITGLPWYVHAPLALLVGAIVGGIYGGKRKKELKNFIKSLELKKVTRVAVVTTSGAGKKRTASSEIVELLKSKGITVLGELNIRGSAFIFPTGHPNEADLKEAADWAEIIIKA